MLAHALLNELDLMFGNRSNTVYLSAQSIEDAVLDAELVIGGGAHSWRGGAQARKGLNVAHGQVTCKAVARALGCPCVSADLKIETLPH